ncbi:MAG: anaerobic sulfite reductase subunit AsrB [Firmicutes bacterium HGW-Firmicutes-1]|jgi:anaerobic sulfite reductase subunit B|nr:MAG: anaerobic sulfite reductase subunit AsrB [Firmicutes bacterium HGW-Firmicutes-1]
MNNPYLMERIKILDVHTETDIDYTFTLEYTKNVLPGQFLQLSIPGVGEAPISISDYDDNKLFLTIRKVGTLTDKIFELQAGDFLYVRGPYGNGFHLKDYSNSHVKIIAGGTGLAPVKKVIKSLMSSKEVKSVKVLVGFKGPKDILFKEELQEWVEAGKANITVDIADANWQGKTGLITEHLNLLEISNIHETKIIVVGPPIMMKFTTLELVKRGVPEENIWVSFERKMSCGIGKCGHCKIDETYVCLEGPVFKYERAKNLID